ncbi:transmembrane protein 145-like isoform X2 [Thrips palmi]|uniref:Transmembrane protein 145-like isoform X2 n=1 Tax=Thrips palmi TaxID=161013 RepID=A0A6P8YDR7_THRPL|nr:transmembrane protein 145-like isoform X2 [Thrips palmi]
MTRKLPPLLPLLKVAFVLVLLHRTGAKYEEGHLVTPENWAFLARFCFLSDDGTFEYQIEYDKEYATQNLLLYHDVSRQWPAVYKSNKTCEQKESVLSVAQNQVVNLTELRADSGCVLTTVPPLPKQGNSTTSPSSAAGAGAGGAPRGRKQAPVVRRHILTCHSVRRFRSARERWWFLAISNCNATKGLNLRYRFLMTNGPPGDYWHEHFSADEFYILPTLMFFSICYLLMIVAIVMCTVELRSRQLLHATYKIFVASVTLQALGVMFQSISYIRYALDGVGFPRTRQLGRLLEAGSETTFLLLLLLLAKGFTVTRGRLRVGSSIKLTIFMCLYVVTYVSLFIYEREFFDPGEVLYLFESPAGYGLMALRIVAWWMFVYSTVFTLKHYPEKATFYYPFNLLATLWFVAGPCFIMSANSLIDKWVRESVVYAVLHTIAFLGHLQFLRLAVCRC